MLNKAMFAGIALGAFMILGGASTARADDWRSCEEKIEHERHELDRLYAKCRYRGDRDRDYYRDYR